MRIATTIAHWVVRLTGLTQVILGLLFWTNNALTLIPLHMLIGLTFVLGLWTLTILAGLAGVDRRLVAGAAVWGLVVIGLGITQVQLLPGAFHWIIEVLHLLVGFAAMGLGQGLATRIAERQLAPPVA